MVMRRTSDGGVYTESVNTEGGEKDSFHYSEEEVAPSTVPEHAQEVAADDGHSRHMHARTHARTHAPVPAANTVMPADMT
jgi:hypothetical protein